MRGVNVAQHVSAAALAPFLLVGLRAMEAIEGKTVNRIGNMNEEKEKNMAGHKKGQIPPLEERKCGECGNPFMPERRNQVVCSDECRFLRSRRLSMQAKRTQRGVDLSPRGCAVCGEIFTPRRKNERCCCEACKGTYMLENTRRNMLRHYYGVPTKNMEKRRKFLVEAIAAYKAELEKIDAMIGNKQPEAQEAI